MDCNKFYNICKGKETVDYILNREYEIAEMIKDIPTTNEQDNTPQYGLLITTTN